MGISTSRTWVHALLCSVLALTVASGKTKTISSNKPRGIMDILQQLEQTYGWRITYEDPPYESADDLVDAASSGYKAANPGAAFLIPRPRLITISFEEPTDPKVVADKQAAIDAIIARAVQNGGGSFTVLHNGDFSHVFPKAVKKTTGETSTLVPLLDTPVSLPAAMRTVGEAVEAVLSQVSRLRGMSIAEGTIPTNLFRNQTEMTEAHNEKARDVLVRFFEDANGDFLIKGLFPIRVTWHLLYDANEHGYFFNAHVIYLPRGPRSSNVSPGK
jgi:hypothetical protein